MRQVLQLTEVAEFVFRQLAGPGAFLTAIDRQGRTNVMTIGWALLGWGYRGHPICAVAVAPPRFTWRFLEETDDFVVAAGGPELAEALSLCGTRSGRDLDKFAAAHLTPIGSVHVRAPSIRECSVNIECRTYLRQRPPHQILTPEHRQSPLEVQHTIYFAEVLGIYRGEEGR